MATLHPTPAEIASAFRYDPDSGIITKASGKPVGTASPRGYVYVCISGISLLAHRVAWCLAHGEWPTHQIDHINGNKSDNRLANLRDVTGLVNSQNMHRAKRNNQVGALNVSRYRSGRYVARLYRNGRRIYLGVFDTPELAAQAVEAVKNSPT